MPVGLLWGYGRPAEAPGQLSLSTERDACGSRQDASTHRLTCSRAATWSKRRLVPSLRIRGTWRAPSGWAPWP